MNDWLNWNGVRSTEMGIYVIEQPPITIPEERIAFEEVRGRSGALARTEGQQIYTDMVMPAECLLRRPDDLGKVAAWLQGSGQVEFGNRPGGYYRARVVNQIEFARVIAANPQRRFTVNFRCQPGWIHRDVSDFTVTESGTEIRNPGTLPSLPRIEIAGQGSFMLSIGTNTVFLEDIDGGIILDSELGDALTSDGANLANRHWSGQPLVINPGTSFVTWTLDEGASVSSVKISPRWQSL